MVLDASALLTLLHSETGAEIVASSMTSVAVIGAVNLSEVVAKLSDAGVPGEAIRDAIGPLGLQVIDFDTEPAYKAGLLRPSTRASGLSLGAAPVWRSAASLACQC